MPHDNASVLIVDDTPVNLRLLVSVLARKHYNVRAARSGLMALESVRSDPPDLILLDVNMPDMNGYEVCTYLKTNPATQSIPIIFISALNDTEDIVKAFEIGGVDYITKPFKVREVLARVEAQITLVSQRRKIEQLLERDRQQFARIDEMRQAFISNMTHDAKNPLALINAYVNLLERYTYGDPSVGEQLHMIRLGVQQMKLLVTDILDLVHIDVQPHTQLEPVSITRSLQVCYETFRERAAEKHLAFEMRPPELEIAVDIDQERLARCLDNLMMNAMKCTVNGSITLSATSANDTVVIEVQDTGLGIPAADLPYIFNAFYRASNDTSKDGSGLGLFIVKTIVEQHGGQIEGESVIGQGSTFRIILPIAAPAPRFVDDDSLDDVV